MVRFISKRGISLLVHESKVEQFKAAGYKLAADEKPKKKKSEPKAKKEPKEKKEGK